MGRFSARNFTILEEGSTLGSSTVSEDDSSVALISSVFRIHQHVGRMIDVKFTHSISVRSLDILEEASLLAHSIPVNSNISEEDSFVCLFCRSRVFEHFQREAHLCVNVCYLCRSLYQLRRRLNVVYSFYPVVSTW